MTYQHPQNWLVLILIMAAAAWIRHFFNLRHQDVVKPSILVSGAVAMAAITLWVSWPQTVAKASASGQSQVAVVQNAPSQQQVTALIDKHCTSCHSRQPTDDIFKIAPLGVVFDNWQDIERYAGQIHRRATVTKDMPFMNKTGMTEQERQQLDVWFKSTQN